MIDNATQTTETPGKPVRLPLPPAPVMPKLPERGTCPSKCDCKEPPPANDTPGCFAKHIEDQHILVTKAERAKKFAEELEALQAKIKSAQANYTQARFIALRRIWKDQDKRLAAIINSLVCSVPCWECLLACRICPLLTEIRKRDEWLNGPPGADPKGVGPLTNSVYSLADQQAWHVRNVKQLQDRLDRITNVMGAWVAPSEKLEEVLSKNDASIAALESPTQKDIALAIYNVFMIVLPTHWAIRPRNPLPEWKSAIDEKYLHICECPPKPKPKPPQDEYCETDGEEPVRQPAKPECQCDDGMPDTCCGPDVGIPSQRQRLIGPLPYIIDVAALPEMLCCLATHRLVPASDQLAAARAEQETVDVKIKQVEQEVKDLTENIQKHFLAGFGDSIDCSKFQPKKPPQALEAE